MLTAWAQLGSLPIVLVAAVAHGQPRVAVSNEDGGDVAILDIATDRVVARVPVGLRPRGLRATRDGRLFVALSGSPRRGPTAALGAPPRIDPTADGIAEVDPAGRRLLRTLEAGPDPESFDMSRDQRTLFVANEDSAEVSVVDVASGRVVARARTGREPEGVRVTPDGRFVYVTSENDNLITVVDVELRAAVASIPTGARPRNLVFTADGARGLVACERGAELTVLDARRHAVLGHVDLSGTALPGAPLGAMPMGLALAPDGRTLFVSTGRGGTIAVVDLGTLRVLRSFAAGGARPWGLAISPDGRKLYTANGPSNDVSVIATATGRLLRRVAVGSSPWDVVVLP